MRRWIVPVVLVLALAALIGWRLLVNRNTTGAQGRQMGMRRGMAASVELATAGRRDLVNSYETTGTVASFFDVKISPKITGRIELPPGRRDLAREGDHVRKGQVLFRIDSSDIDAQVQQQRAALAQAQYRLAQAQMTQAPTDEAVTMQIRQQQAAVASAKADVEQVSTNYASQVAAARANVTDAENKIAGAAASKENAQSAIDSAAAAIANARIAISTAQANLDNASAKNNRILTLYKQGYVAAQDVDDAKTAVSVQQNALETAQGQLQVQQKTAEIAQGQLKTATASYNSVLAQKQAVEQQLNIVLNKGKADIETANARQQQAQAALDYARANTAQTPAYRESLKALDAGVAAAQATLDSARAKLADTVLHAPIDGTVTARYLDPGALASPSQPVLAVEALNKVWVEIAVPEDVCVKIHLGQPATVRFDALPGQVFTATLAQINPSANPQSRQFTVRAILDNAKNLFKAGMFARVTLETERITGAVVVPPEAIETDQDGAYVMGVAEDRTARRIPVVTGASDATGTAILSGVKPGDKVVVTSTFPLRDGQPVSLNDGRGGPGGRGGRRSGAGPGGGPDGGRDGGRPQGAPDGAGGPGPGAAPGNPAGRGGAGDGGNGAGQRRGEGAGRGN